MPPVSESGGRSRMNIYFLDYPITYTGEQLRPHLILKTTNITGDALVAFHGPCQVKTEALVDLHDQANKAFIYSESMVHLIGEWFQSDLETTVLKQRLLVATVGEIIREKSNYVPRRRGNDLYIDNRKLTVSVATISPVSTLLHLGINISDKNTPVPAIGLENLRICQFEITNLLLERFKKECEDIAISRAKVRSVA